MYTTIIHPIRKALNLSIREYVVLDSIYHLSHNKRYGYWCVMSKKQLGDTLDLSERTILRILNVLEKKDLLERDKQTGWVRSKDVYNEKIANKHDWIIGFKGKEEELLHGRVQNGAMGDSLSPDTMTVCHPEGDSLSYNNNNININNNNNSSSSKKNEVSPQNSDTGLKKRKDIDDVLLALKAAIGISAFVDSSIERNMAKHCLGLIEKIGGQEFRRRLDILLEDSFHSKNMNKIKYVYNNIKGFKEPQVKSRTIKI